MSTHSRLPRWFAIAGIALAVSYGVGSWFIYKFNLFHLPTVAEAQQMGSFNEPFGLRLFDGVFLSLCPAAFMFILTIDVGETSNMVMWVVVSLVNGGIYYAIGLIIAALMKLRKSHTRTPPASGLNLR